MSIRPAPEDDPDWNSPEDSVYDKPAVYVVIHVDRHADTEVYVFTGKDAAISYAEALAADAAWHPDSLNLDYELTDGMKMNGWVRYIPYGSESDSVRVVVREARNG